TWKVLLELDQIGTSQSLSSQVRGTFQLTPRTPRPSPDEIPGVGLLTILAGAILLAGGGPSGITLHGFGLSSLTSGNPAGDLGVALVFVVSSFIGFEATAIFGQEARDPRRTVPRATYIAVLLIAVFYAVCTWTISLDYGPGHIVTAATKNFTGLYQSSMQHHLGGFFVVLLQILMCTSLFACVLSFHNTVNRYLWVVGNEGIVDRRLGATHPRHQSPHVAGAVQFIVIAAAVVLFTVLRLDPTQVVGWCSAFTAVGILMMQVLVSISVVRYFAANSRGVSLWSRAIAPTLSTLSLLGCLVLMSQHIEYVAGTSSVVVKAFPEIIFALMLLGFGFAHHMKVRRPERYEQLGSLFGTNLSISQLEHRSEEPVRVTEELEQHLSEVDQ
ncbi:APC family permease, partial [Leekyejoonella antrihumi]